MRQRRSGARVADRPKAVTGPHEIIAIKRPFAACCKLGRKIYGALTDCRERTYGLVAFVAR